MANTSRKLLALYDKAEKELNEAFMGLSYRGTEEAMTVLKRHTLRYYNLTRAMRKKKSAK
jgi:hypothetical protein